MTASPEFSALLATTELEREKADGINSLIAASKLAAGYQTRAEKAEAALARVAALVDCWPAMKKDGSHWDGCHLVHADCFVVAVHVAMEWS